MKSKVFSMIKREKDRQHNNIELIASENFVSKNILKAVGSCLTNKYAEGYSHARYYGGCQYIDEVESYAVELAKKLFNSEYANVQPHSGSQANAAVYLSVLKPGDKVLALSLNSGGHLTHGHKLSFSGQLYDFYSYDVNPTTLTLDYDAIREKALEVMPKMIVTGASNYSRFIDFAKFKEIADEVGAYLMVDMAHIAGMVAVGLHPSPIPYADFVTSTTHKTLRGPRGGLILSKAKYQTLLDKALFPGIQGGPLEHVIAGKAICFEEALQPSFYAYQQQLLDNMKALCKFWTSKGVTLISGGSDNHLVTIDTVKSFGLSGVECETLLDKIHITVNKNSIPFDTKSPKVSSGIRIGSAAMTTKGLVEKDFEEIGSIIYDYLSKTVDESTSLSRVQDIISKTVEPS